MTDLEYLQTFFFETKEEPIYRSVVDPDGVLRSTEIPGRKLIIRSDNNSVISDVTKQYKIIPHREIIEPMLEYLDKTDIKWEIDKDNSYVGSGNMFLRIKYPDLKVEDDSKEGLILGHSIHNAYTTGNSLKVIDYIWRKVCSNGLMRLMANKSLWFKHTSGFSLENYKHQLESLLVEAPVIGERIQVLMNLEAKQNMLEQAREVTSKGMYDYASQEVENKGGISQLNQWQLLNIFTYYISHLVQARMRAAYQYQVSKMFTV